MQPNAVIPAQAGIQTAPWMLAFASKPKVQTSADQPFGPPRDTPTLAGRSTRSPIV